MHFRFNAWGEKWSPWDADAAVGASIATHLGLPVYEVPMVLEGGSIAVDGAGLLVTFVLAGLGGLEHWVRRARRVVSATIRTRTGTQEEVVATTLRAHGIRIEGRQVYDHEQDRTFEMKLSGPSRQFDVATAALLSRDDVYGVHLD